MFVRLSKYRKIVAEAATLYDRLLQEMARCAEAKHVMNEWRALAHTQNKQIEMLEAEKLWHQKQAEQLAAEVSIARMSNAKVAPQFTQEQIRTLITLCHPDKHCGKESAKTITQHLLQMRK